MKQNASPGEQSEAPRRRRKPGQEQHPGPENQDSQHMLNQPRMSFPERFGYFLFFFCSGGGEKGSCPKRWPGVSVLIEMVGGGGVARMRGGGGGKGEIEWGGEGSVGRGRGGKQFFGGV